MARPRARAWSDEDLHRAALLAIAPDGSLRKAAGATGVSLGTLRNYLAAHPELRDPDPDPDSVARELLVKVCRGIDLALLTPTGIDVDAVQRSYDQLVDRIAAGGCP